MLTDENINFVYNGTPGIPLVWVIDGDCIYDLALSQEHAAIFLEADEVLNVSEEYPEHVGITVRFKKNGETLEDFQTSDYFGNCLLSSPQVLKLSDYPYGRYVVSPYARFENGQFIILNRDVTGFLP